MNAAVLMEIVHIYDNDYKQLWHFFNTPTTKLFAFHADITSHHSVTPISVLYINVTIVVDADLGELLVMFSLELGSLNKCLSELYSNK